MNKQKKYKWKNMSKKFLRLVQIGKMNQQKKADYK